MILVTITINSVEHRVSTEQLLLTNIWDAKVIDSGSISYRVAKMYGGYAKPDYGQMSFMPDLFSGTDWPPPNNCAVKIEHTETTEAAATTLFEGTAHLVGVNRSKVVYDLHTQEIDSAIEAGSFTGTLLSLFTTYCGGSYLNLTLDHTYDRASSPLVRYYTSSTKQCLDLLSEISAFHTHCFYISGSTLHLVDMLQSNGSSTLTEFDFFPVEYQYNEPVSLFLADTDSVSGSYSYGEEYEVSPVGFMAPEWRSSDSASPSHSPSPSPSAGGQQLNPREIALTNIKTIMERPQVVMRKPLDTSSLPAIGEKIHWNDESLNEEIAANLWVREMTYDLNREVVTVVGDGVIDAPTSSASASPSGSPSHTVSASPSHTESTSPSATPSGGTGSASTSPSATASSSPSATPSATPSGGTGSVSASPSHTASVSPSHTVSVSPSHTVSTSPSATPSGGTGSASTSPSTTISASPSGGTGSISHSPSDSPSRTESASPSEGTPSRTASASPSEGTPSGSPST